MWPRSRTGWLLLPLLLLPLPVGAQSANLAVDATQTVRTVDERVFGVNAVLWDPQTSDRKSVV